MFECDKRGKIGKMLPPSGFELQASKTKSRAPYQLSYQGALMLFSVAIKRVYSDLHYKRISRNCSIFTHNNNSDF
jgi:hypothetical protein